MGSIDQMFDRLFVLEVMSSPRPCYCEGVPGRGRRREGGSFNCKTRTDEQVYVNNNNVSMFALLG